MYIIKLGGSIVTYKRDDIGPPYYWNETTLTYRVRKDNLKNISRQLSSIPGEKIILVHGGGTHGHRTVLRWKKGIAKGRKPMMAWEVRWRMDQLTESISSVLGRNKLPVIPVSPSDILRSSGGSVRSMNTQIILDILDRDCIPMLRGDIHPDDDGDWSVISGDIIVEELVKYCRKGSLPKLKKVMMCMEEEGFIKDFGKEGAHIVDKMEKGDLKKVIENGMDHHASSDVTGGMMSKLKTCSIVVDMGYPIQLIGGDLSKNLERALNGEMVGTTFLPYSGPK